MSRFRQTLEQALATGEEQFAHLREWPQETVPGLLDLIWLAYHHCAKRLSAIDMNTATLQLERSATQLLAQEIQALLIGRGGYASYTVIHEAWSMENVEPGSNRPAQPDLAFVWRGREILKWPCEAKVLKHETDLKEYLADVRAAFVGCVYGPFSASGAMLGFLLRGRPDDTLRIIGQRLDLPMQVHPDFSDRPHRYTHLRRKVPANSGFPETFHLHHLILQLGELGESPS